MKTNLEGQNLLKVDKHELGVREGKIGRTWLRRIVNASAPILEGAVMEAVEPGSIVYTDEWEGHMGLSKIGYAHEVIRKKADVGKNLLPKVNRVVALLKRWLLGTYQGHVQVSHLDYYLDEFTFRFNRRTSCSRGKLFYRLLQQTTAVSSLIEKDIRGGTVDVQTISR